MGAFSFPAKTVVLETASTTAQFVPFTQWMPAAGQGKVKALLKLRDVVDDDVKVRPAYQTAEKDPDTPDAASALGTEQLSAEGAVCTGIETPTTTGKYFIRYGVLVQNVTSTTDLQRAEATLWISGRDT